MTEMLVTYPGGSAAEQTEVLATTRAGGGELLFAVQRTPCHPQSLRWPDQPADRCFVEVEGRRAETQCAEGFFANPSGELTLQPPDGETQAAPPTRCVVHRVSEDFPLAPGQAVTLAVDEDYRAGLSRGHSYCHVVSLALNTALAEAWRKDPPARDALGAPDFDRLAIQSSEIRVDGSVDTYRIGKHLRKSGFVAEALSDPDELARQVQTIAHEWVQDAPAISLTPGVCALEDRRTWSCELGRDRASLDCGGTHTPKLNPAYAVEVQISWDPEDRRLVMTARSGARAQL